MKLSNVCTNCQLVENEGIITIFFLWNARFENFSKYIRQQAKQFNPLVGWLQQHNYAPHQQSARYY